MRDEKGFTLIEVLVAVALLGLISVALIVALATASKVLIIADEQTTAESLARSQIEYIKTLPYSPADDYDVGLYDTISIPEGYAIFSIDRDNVAVDEVVGIPWNIDPNSGTVGPVDMDAGLQLIRLSIRHHGKVVLRLDGVKVDR